METGTQVVVGSSGAAIGRLLESPGLTVPLGAAHPVSLDLSGSRGAQRPDLQGPQTGPRTREALQSAGSARFSAKAPSALSRPERPETPGPAAQARPGSEPGQERQQR